MSSNHNSYPISKEHSSAFIDIDGDCVNDLIINSEDKKGNKFIEVWRGIIDKETKSLTYCLVQNSVYSISSDIGLFSIADVNRDGMLDLIFPITSGNPRILVAYNQINLVFDWEDDYCSKHLNSDNKLTQVFLPLSSDNSSNAVSSNDTDSLKNQIVHLYNENSQTFYSSELIPIYIRVGDVNIDSYPDITFVLQNKDSTRTAYVYFNCELEDDTSNSTTSVVRRTFSQNCNESISELDFVSPSNAIYSSFFDLDENGQLDLIITTKEDTDVFKIKSYYANYNFDSFFLKSENFMKQYWYSTFIIGTTYRFITTNLDGSRRLDVAQQNSQTNSLCLSLPYAFIGIGRSNNYIENFHVISPTFTDTNNYVVFTPIIPNSQLLVSENLTEKNTLNWTLDLIVNPTSKLFLLVVVIAATLIGLLVVIVILHTKEVKEDQENENFIFNEFFN